MKFLIILSKDNKKLNDIQKDRLIFIIEQLLTQSKQTEPLTYNLYFINRDYNNLPMLEKLKELSKLAQTFKMEWKDFNNYFAINVFYGDK